MKVVLPAAQWPAASTTPLSAGLVPAAVLPDGSRLLWADDEFTPEERRAALPRYRLLR